MAVIKAVNSKNSLKNVIQYITDKEKTEEKLISGKGCNPQSALEEMQTTKEQFNKLDGRQYKHFIQSFDPHDNLDYQKAHKIGLEWAEKSFKGYEVLVATHQDKNHIHNHFVVNSVSFENGEKYRYSKWDLGQMKELSDRICERENLRVITQKTPGKELSMNEYQVAIRGESWKFKLINEIDKSLAQAKSKEDFIKSMEDNGHKVTWSDTRKYITYTTPEGNKVRDNKLHDIKYTKEAMENGFRSIKESELNRGNTGADRTQGNREGFGLSWSKSEVGTPFSRTNQPEQQSIKTPGTEREGQKGLRTEIQADQRGQEQPSNSIKSTDKGLEARNRGHEERELSEVRADSKEGFRRADQEPGQQQGAFKASDGISVPGEENTESIVPGKGETILDTTRGNSGFDGGHNGAIPTGNPLAEAFKALGSAIQKAEQKEQALAYKERVKLERQMNKQQSKNKDRGRGGWER